jgi:uncharacterized membrane protein
MSNYWWRMGKGIYNSIQWCFGNHPGKSTGFLVGFFLALAFILLGFWQTIILVGLSSFGYYIGKCWDDRDLPLWLNRLIHRLYFRSKE